MIVNHTLATCFTSALVARSTPNLPSATSALLPAAAFAANSESPCPQYKCRGKELEVIPTEAHRTIRLANSVILVFRIISSVY